MTASSRSTPDPARHAEPGVVDRAWDVLTRPAVVGTLLLGLALIGALDALSPQMHYAGVVRVLATLSVGAAVALSARLIEGPASWSAAFVRQALACGLVQRAWLPFFDEELSATARTELVRLRGGRMSIGAALAVGLLMATPGVALLASHAPGVAAGHTTVAVGNTAETFELERVASGVLRNLGLKVDLAALSQRDDGRWAAELVVRDTASDAENRITLLSGERARLRDRVVSLAEVQSLARAGRVLLTLTPTAGGEAVSVAFPVGGQHELPDGTLVSVPEATLSFARQLGPAARVVERQGDVIVSDRWVFASDAGFDARHGEGLWSAQIDEIEPMLAATLAVSDVLATPLRPGASALVWLGALAVFLGLSLRAGPVAVGRSGDYALYSIGWFGAHARAQRSVGRMLTSDQRAELDAVLTELRSAGA